MDTETALHVEQLASELSTRIADLADAFVSHVKHDAGETRLVADLAEQVGELAGEVAQLGRLLTGYWTLTQRAASTKSATDYMTCVECGTEFGAEPGPSLCGPCWVKLGKPTTWKATPGTGLYVVPAGMDRGLYRWHAARPGCSGLFTYNEPRPEACPGCGNGGTHDAC